MDTPCLTARRRLAASDNTYYVVRALHKRPRVHSNSGSLHNNFRFGKASRESLKFPESCYMSVDGSRSERVNIDATIEQQPGKHFVRFLTSIQAVPKNLRLVGVARGCGNIS